MVDRAMSIVIHECDGAYREAPQESYCSVLFVGEDNPQSARGEHALYDYPDGCAGHRLSQILGKSSEEYLALWRTNLCCPSWSAKKARERAHTLLVQDEENPPPWGTIVMLGAKVAGVFNKIYGSELRPFEYRLRQGSPWGSMNIAYLPHPSGRNLVWNDRGNWLRARQVMHEVAPELWGKP